MKTVGSFQVKSLKDAGLASGKAHGMIAKSDRFEVWGNKHLVGNVGQRRYHITYSAVCVVSREPRRIENVVLPPNVQSNLDKVLAHLETL